MLETVSGSSQFVLQGQVFQPLSMRVTDGTTADDPVMGVNVTFATTLTQISPQNTGQGGQQGGETIGGTGALPILLGASQTQVVTDINGIASITPSAGNVGPCDVLIAVSAGAASVQFRMENLAPIVPQLTTQQPPKSVPAQSPVADVAPVSAPTAQPSSFPVELFAIAQEGPIEPDTSNLPSASSSTAVSEGDASGVDTRETAPPECEPSLRTPRPEAASAQGAGRDEKVDPSQPSGDKELPATAPPAVSTAATSSSATSSSPDPSPPGPSSTDQPNH
jgi:hypothetical protein